MSQWAVLGWEAFCQNQTDQGNLNINQLTAGGIAGK